MTEWWTYRLSDFLLFSADTYYRLFELYNESIWPVHPAVILAILGMGYMVLKPTPWSGRILISLFGAIWLWIAWGYHLSHFSTINWAATYYAAGFALEGLLLLLMGGFTDSSTFSPGTKAVTIAGLGLAGFGLIIHPLIGPLSGRPWAQIELFGLAPDPTAVATLGLVLLAGKYRWVLLPLPLLWCLVSGATLWTMGMADCWVLFGAALIAGAVGLGKRRLRHPLTAVWVLLLLSGCQPAQELSDHQVGTRALEASIDSVAYRALEEGPIAGLAIAVSRDGALIHASGYGYADVEQGIQATANTAFTTASVGKHLTATVVLSLVQDGLLDLDASLSSVLPSFPDTAQGNRITVRHLLNHTSGIPNYARLAYGSPEAEQELQAPALFAVLAGEPLEFEPGSDWSYSNTGYYLLGLIIEQVTSQPYDIVLRERIAAPLHAPSIRPVFVADPDSNLAQSYTVDADASLIRSSLWEQLSPTTNNVRVSAGFLRASVLDLVALEQALTEGRLLRPEWVQAMRSPTTLGSAVTAPYGLGTRLGHLGGIRKVGHTGGADAYRAILAHYPDRDLTIAVLINTDLPGGSPLDALTVEAEVARILLELPRQPVQEQSLASGQAISYTGMYVSGRDTIEVFTEDHQLFIGERDGDRTPYFYQGNHRFANPQWPTWVIEFDVSSGEARQFTGYDGGWFSDYRYTRVLTPGSHF